MIRILFLKKVSIVKSGTLADTFLTNLDELSDNEADYDVDAEDMDEDVDGHLDDLENLNNDDLDSVSKLQKTQRKTRDTLKLYRIHSVDEYVNSPWLMVCNSKETVIQLVKLVDMGVARLTMEVVGMMPATAMNFMFVWMKGELNVSVLSSLKVMV